MGCWASFIALDLEKIEANKIVREMKDKLKKYNNIISWHNPNYLHLTLNYFDWLEETQIGIIEKLLTEVQNKIPDKILIKDEIICIGGNENKYVALEIDKKNLIPLKKDMDTLLIKHRIDYKIQEFRPHISLGRIKKGSLIKLKNIEQAIGVKGISLYESKEYSISIMSRCKQYNKK